jgi:hypothetical protein
MGTSSALTISFEPGRVDSSVGATEAIQRFLDLPFCQQALND